MSSNATYSLNEDEDALFILYAAINPKSSHLVFSSLPLSSSDAVASAEEVWERALYDEEASNAFRERCSRVDISRRAEISYAMGLSTRNDDGETEKGGFEVNHEYSAQRRYQNVLSTPDLADTNWLALLRLSDETFLIQQNTVYIGSCEERSKSLHINLSPYDPFHLIEKRHVILAFTRQTEFLLKNVSLKHPVFVDGFAVPPGAARKLEDSSVIQIRHIKLVFEINHKVYLAFQRAKSTES